MWDALAGVLFAVNAVMFVVGILRGKINPPQMTWLIWMVLDVIVLATLIAEDKVNKMIIVAVAQAIAGYVLSFWYGEKKWTTADRWCGAGAALTLVALLLTRDAVVGLVLSLAIIALGTVPLLYDRWRDPYKDSLPVYLMSMASSVCAILDKRESTDATWVDFAQPTTFLVIQIVVGTLLVWRRLQLGPSSTEATAG